MTFFIDWQRGIPGPALQFLDRSDKTVFSISPSSRANRLRLLNHAAMGAGIGQEDPPSVVIGKFALFSELTASCMRQ